MYELDPTFGNFCLLFLIAFCLYLLLRIIDEKEANRQISLNNTEALKQVWLTKLERSEMIDLFSKLANGEPDHAKEQDEMEDRIAAKVAAKLSSTFNAPDEAKDTDEDKTDVSTEKDD